MLVSKDIGRCIEQSRRSYRLRTSQMRPLPDFVVIGAQKCGTTFLYRLVKAHPYVVPATIKEIHYFDLHFKKGIRWYRAHFPLAIYKYVSRLIRKRTILTGEVSPYYLYHPHVSRRMAEVVPHAKLIVLLRNPIDRAYSNYHHEVRGQYETLSFEEAIAAEEKRLHNEVEKMLKDERYNSFNHLHYSYLHRGIYVDQLQAFAKFFDNTQMLILKSETFYERPLRIFQRVLDFLNLPEWTPEEFTPANVGNYATEMSAETRRRLSEYFEPHNQRLYKYIGENFGWEK